MTTSTRRALVRPVLMRHTWFWVLIVGAILYSLVLRTLHVTGNINLVPSAILLGAFLIPVTFITWISGRVHADEGSFELISMAGLFGGVIGVVVASRLEYNTIRDLGFTPVLAIGLIEEAAKLIVPIGILILLRSRRPASGLLVGVAVGMGFAALETMGYAFVALLQSKGNLGAVEVTLLFRGVLSPAAHGTWTGVATAMLWRAAQSGRLRGWVLFLLAYLGVSVLHACWDGIGTWWSYLLLCAISVVLIQRQIRAATVGT